MHRRSACTSIIKANNLLEPPCSIPLKPFAWRVNGRFEFLRLKAAVSLCKQSKHMLLNPMNCFPSWEKHKLGPDELEDYSVFLSNFDISTAFLSSRDQLPSWWAGVWFPFI